MKGYWLVLGTEVTDQAAQAEYGRLWGPIAQRYGARLIAGDGAPQLMERRDTARVVLVEFPSYEAAQACYNDPAYQDALHHAQKASQREVLLFKGQLS